MKPNAPVKRLSVGRASVFIYREEDQDKTPEERAAQKITPVLPLVPEEPAPPKPAPVQPKPMAKPAPPVLPPHLSASDEPKSAFFPFWVALLLTLLYAPMIYVYLMYEIVKTKDFAFRKFDEGFIPTLHFLLAIISLASIALIYYVVSAKPDFGRGNLSPPVFLTLAGSFITLAFFQLNPYTNSFSILEKNRPILTLFGLLFVSSLFLSIWALFAREFGYKWLPVIGAGLLQMFLMDEVQLVLREYKYSYLQYFSWIISTALLTAYFVYDLEFIYRRKGLYKSNDHVVALVHLQTDLFYRFWVDLAAKWKRRSVSSEGDAGVVEME